MTNDQMKSQNPTTKSRSCELHVNLPSGEDKGLFGFRYSDLFRYSSFGFHSVCELDSLLLSVQAAQFILGAQTIGNLCVTDNFAVAHDNHPAGILRDV